MRATIEYESEDHRLIRRAAEADGLTPEAFIRVSSLQHAARTLRRRESRLRYQQPVSDRRAREAQRNAGTSCPA